MACSPQGSSVHGIFQARILEWVAIPTPGDLPGDLPDPGIEPGSPALQADSLPSEPPGKPHLALPFNFPPPPPTRKFFFNLYKYLPDKYQVFLVS